MEELRKSSLKIVTMDYRMTISVPIESSISTKNFPNDICRLIEFLNNIDYNPLAFSIPIGHSDRDTMLSIATLAKNHGAVSIEGLYELPSLYGRPTLICTFVFLSDKNMLHFKESLSEFET